jgi:hypothetical protein
LRRAANPVAFKPAGVFQYASFENAFPHSVKVFWRAARLARAIHRSQFQGCAVDDAIRSQNAVLAEVQETVLCGTEDQFTNKDIETKASGQDEDADDRNRGIHIPDADRCCFSRPWIHVFLFCGDICLVFQQLEKV